MEYKQAQAVVRQGESITIYVSYPLPGQPDFHERLSRPLYHDDYKQVAVSMLRDAGFNVGEVKYTHLGGSHETMV